MYLVLIVLLMAVLPAVSIIIEMVVTTGADFMVLVGKWFVFWAVGVRLFTAGIRQVAQPSYTAETIFQIKDKSSEKLVSEIGFSNLSIGLLGLLTIFSGAWVVPAAIVSAPFYGLAGIKHVLNGHRSRTETIAMTSDLAMFVVLALFLLAVAIR